jgi:hypothetical protein
MLNTFKTFKKRAAEISDHAHNPRGALGEGADFLRGLDETEIRCLSSPRCMFLSTLLIHLKYSDLLMTARNRLGNGWVK